MPHEPRLLTGRDHAPQRHGDRRVDSALADEPALVGFLSVLRSPNLERPRLASFSQPPTRWKSTAATASRSTYDFSEPPPIGFVLQNGSRRRLEGVRRSAAACARRSQSGGRGLEARAAMQNEANLLMVDSVLTDVCERGYVSSPGLAGVENKANFGVYRAGR